MEELKRIFFSRKLMGALALLLVLNGWFTWNAQKPDKDVREYYEKNYQGDFFGEENDKYRELLQEYQAMDIEEAALAMEAYWENYRKQLQENMDLSGQEGELAFSEEDIEFSAISQISQQITYIAGFQEYLRGIDESAERMRKVSALGTEGSFSRRNIDKTVKDFAPLKKIELRLDNERAVSAFTDCTFTGLLLMVMAAVVVIVMLEERKKGLWQFVYSLPGGRCRIAFVRCAGMVLVIFLSGVLLEGENLVITGWYYGGFGDLSRAVQSNPDFSGCVLEITMGTYLILKILAEMIVCVFAGMIFWAALSRLKSHAGAFAVLALMIAGEYYAYTQISPQSAWGRLRYMNLFTFLDSGHALTAYRNLNFPGGPVSVHALLLYVLPVLTAAMCLFVILLGRQRPFLPGENLIGRIYGKIIFAVKPYRHNSIFLHECYKVFIRQKCALIIIALIIFSVLTVDTEKIYYDYGTTIYNQYITQIKGSVTGEKTEYLRSESDIWQNKIMESETKVEKYEQFQEEGSEEYLEIFVSQRDYERELKRIEQYEQAEGIVEELLSLSDRLEKLQPEGVNVGFVNKIGYGMYLGAGSNTRSAGEAMIMLAFLTAALAGIRSYESSQNADKFIKSTKKGRENLYKRKCIVAVTVSLLVFLPVTAAGFYSIYGTYGMAGFGLSVLSLDEFAEFPVDLPLGGFLILVWVLRYLMLSAVAMVVMFLSGRTKNMMISFFTCILVILVPASLVYMGFSSMSFLSVLRPVTVTYFWNKYGFDGIMWFLPCILLLCVGILAWRLGKREAGA